MNKKNNIISVVALIAIVLVIVGFIAYAAQPKSKYSSETLVALAQALATKQVTMYGAAWCSHCKAQKALFGDAFKYVPYVECPDNQKLCLDKGVKGYPTWITADGTKYEGEQTLDRLAGIAGFTLPR